MTRAKPAETSAKGKTDLDKERAIKHSIATLTQHGIEVRREKLRQGPGWKVQSGSCRVSKNSVVFVDRKLSLDEQAVFLEQCLKAVGLTGDVSGAATSES